MLVKTNQVPNEEYISAVLSGEKPDAADLVACGRRLADWNLDRKRFLRRQAAAAELSATEPPPGYDPVELRYRQSIASTILKQTAAVELVSRMTSLIHERGGLLGRSMMRQETLNAERLIADGQARAERLATACDTNAAGEAEIVKEYAAALEELERLKGLLNQYTPAATLEAKEQSRIVKIGEVIDETTAEMFDPANMRFDPDADFGQPQL